MEPSSALLNFWSAHPLAITLVIAWAFVWKGMALWRAAQLGQKRWFIAILVLNTLGLLEIIYLFLIARQYEVKLIEE